MMSQISSAPDARPAPVPLPRATMHLPYEPGDFRMLLGLTAVAEPMRMPPRKSGTNRGKKIMLRRDSRADCP